MKLATPREAFLQNLQLTAAVCPSRSTRPVLMDVLVSVTDGQVQVTATDGDVSIRRRYAAEGISGSGEAALPAATLLSVVRSMDAPEIRIEEKNTVHEVAGGRALFRLNGDDPTLFPSIPILERTRGVEVPLAAFVDLCNRTMFAAAKEMGRYAFNGVLLEIDTHDLTVVATDGRRLALARLDIPTGVKERTAVVVPLKGLVQLLRMHGQEDAVLRIELRETMVAFILPQLEIQAQLVEGEFPDYRAVIPKDGNTPEKVSLRREEFLQAIQRASITAGDEGPTIELKFQAGKLTVSSRQEGVGESRSEMEIEYSGPGVDIRFNPNFLGEYLKNLPDESVSFRFKDRLSAGVFQASEGSLYVVMPITS